MATWIPILCFQGCWTHSWLFNHIWFVPITRKLRKLLFYSKVVPWRNSTHYSDSNSVSSVLSGSSAATQLYKVHLNCINSQEVSVFYREDNHVNHGRILLNSRSSTTTAWILILFAGCHYWTSSQLTTIQGTLICHEN